LNQIRIFITRIGATILIFRGMIMLRKILLPKLTNCTTLNPQFDNHFSYHSSYDYPLEKSSLEDTLKEFMELVDQPTIPVLHEPSLEDTLYAFRQKVNQPCQEIMDTQLANTEEVARLEGQFGHLVSEFNLMDVEEFQSPEIVHPPKESLV
jgi:hypothetical protein